MITEQIYRVAQLIRKSDYVVVFTGAGISTPSGIPDFRSEREGLWFQHDPMQVASHTAFVNSPEIFFDWFRPLFQTSYIAKPNPAHIGLTNLQQAGILKTIITQNIDGLHQKSGSHHVYELHGSALMFTCSKCSRTQSASEVHQQFSSGRIIPVCKHCQAVIKPDVVLFEEMLPAEVWFKAEKEIEQADLLIVIGSSLEVYPASTIPQCAVQRGCRLIINNLTPTPLDDLAEILIPMDAAEFIPLLVKQLSKMS